MAPSDPYDLARFISNQRIIYGLALAEIKRGRKKNHWIWFIFPQLSGLGTSNRSKQFAISSLTEAKAYLADPLLGQRLAELSRAVLDSETATARTLMGDHTDEEKLHACMTLFLRADPERKVFDFQAVLDEYYHGEPHDITDSLLGTNNISSNSNPPAGPSGTSTENPPNIAPPNLDPPVADPPIAGLPNVAPPEDDDDDEEGPEPVEKRTYAIGG